MTFVFVDTETTGLNPAKHQIWEAAYAVEDEVVETGFLAHDTSTADPAALHFNKYLERMSPQLDLRVAVKFEGQFKAALQGATIVAANPAFDTSFLFARWGEAPWHYRLLDVEAYAMPILGYETPQGLHRICKDLRGQGFEVYEPDHSARADVLALRDAFRALQRLNKED